MSRRVAGARSNRVVDTLFTSAAEVDIVAAGKAAAAMLVGVDAWCVPIRRAVGIGVQRPTTLPRGCEWYTGGHPLPDGQSVVAARRVMEVARAQGERDLLVLLLSGGASALMALPVEGVTLGDKRETVQRLLLAGAGVEAINSVRKHVSAIKGGWLAAATRGWLLTLAVSDVVGDDLSTIASGPGVADITTYAMALRVLDEHDGRRAYPPAVVRHLERGQAGEVAETLKPGDSRLQRSTAFVIAGSSAAVEDAIQAARALGYHAEVLPRPVVGEARIAAHELVTAVVGAARRLPRPTCLLATGETTVTVRGRGTGGRNQELALALALAPEMRAVGADRIVAASVGTDGIDGPTDAAGAVVDSTTVARATTAGLAPRMYLDDNNSYAFFEALGDLVRTGPTGTNVGDLQVVLLGD